MPEPLIDNPILHKKHLIDSVFYSFTICMISLVFIGDVDAQHRFSQLHPCWSPTQQGVHSVSDRVTAVSCFAKVRRRALCQRQSWNQRCCPTIGVPPAVGYCDQSIPLAPLVTTPLAPLQTMHPKPATPPQLIAENELSDPVALFDGKSLNNWEAIEFGGEGDIYVEDGLISFEMGDPFTGICSTKDNLPKTNFEISLDARKTDGIDFFCGLTFPVAESHCTLILGGWGGDVCGLSCIDEKDASRNDTMSSNIFEQNKWYKIRVRVEPKHISAWIDDKQIVDANIEGKTISLRGDTTLCAPLGICSFQTNADYKNIELRTIKNPKPSE